MIFAGSLRSRWGQDMRYLGRGPKALNNDQKGLPNRQWEYLGKVPSGKEESKTQSQGGEWQALRRKDFLSEAKLGKVAQSGSSWTTSWGFLEHKPCCLLIWWLHTGLRGVSRMELRSEPVFVLHLSVLLGSRPSSVGICDLLCGNKAQSRSKMGQSSSQWK